MACPRRDVRSSRGTGLSASRSCRPIRRSRRDRERLRGAADKAAEAAATAAANTVVRTIFMAFSFKMPPVILSARLSTFAWNNLLYNTIIPHHLRWSQVDMSTFWHSQDTHSPRSSRHLPAVSSTVFASSRTSRTASRQARRAQAAVPRRSSRAGTWQRANPTGERP